MRLCLSFFQVFCLLLAVNLRTTVSAQIPARIDSLENTLQHSPRDTARVNALLDLVEFYNHQDYGKCLAYSKTAVHLSDSLGYDRGIALASYYQGSVYSRLGTYDQATKSFLLALEKWQVVRDTFQLGRTYNTMGYMYDLMRDYPQAIEYFQKALEKYNLLDVDRPLLVTKHNIATAWMNDGDFDKAIPIFYENLGKAKAGQMFDLQMATYNNLGYIAMVNERLDSSIYFYDLALAAADSVSIKILSAQMQANMAEALIEAGQFPRAEKILLSSLEKGVESGDLKTQFRAHELLYMLYKRTKRYAEAVEETGIYLELRDSIYNDEKQDKVNNLEIAWESQQKDLEIQLLEEQQAAQRDKDELQVWLLRGAGIAIILLGIMLGLLIRMGRKRMKTNERLVEKQNELEANRALLLEQNQRLEAAGKEKDKLIGVVAHDIRTPINNMDALLNMMESEGEFTPMQQQLAALSHKSAEIGKRLIQDLLDLHVYEQKDFDLRLEEIRLGPLLEDLMTLRQPDAAEKSILLLLEQEELPPLRSHSDSLRRILENLLSNAIKFSEPETQITLRAYQGSQSVIVEVADQGPGISKADQQKMFGKFQRLSARPTAGESSTGLGLSIVKTLCDRLGITISVTSVLGSGTTFKLEIPT